MDKLKLVILSVYVGFETPFKINTILFKLFNNS
jgi:hypothetical protein